MRFSVRDFAQAIASAALVVETAAAPSGKCQYGCGDPVVDLGYAQYQGVYSANGSYYNFTNIRYAAPPVGNLRWRAPQRPLRNRTAIQTSGNYPIVCPQASPGWSQGLDPSTINPLNVSLPAQAPGSSEDCLFLDVFSPKAVFEGKKCDAPVMVWIYGGGFTGGSKSGSGSPAGLLQRSLERPNDDGVVYVAMNYRLGALGWLSSGGTEKDLVANAALLDQRFALQWVQEHIHLFGGNKDKVTVFGESAGGASVMHQILAYGGPDRRHPSPFKKAIIQSPGWNPATSSPIQARTYKALLSLLNVTTIAEARKLPSSAAILANYRQVFASAYSSYTYGPVVDGSFVPEQPAQLLANGSFDKTITVMAGHNANEGQYFVPQQAGLPGAFDLYLASSLPEASNETLQYISTVLYPPIYDGSQGYTTGFERAVKAYSEYVFTCNTYYVMKAFAGTPSFAYKFAVPPAIHGQDVDWTYFVGDARTPNQTITQANPFVVSNVNVAIAFQEYLTGFAQTGRPVAGKGYPAMERWGKDANIVVIGQDGITRGTDDTANDRCRWWQKQEYLKS